MQLIKNNSQHSQDPDEQGQHSRAPDSKTEPIVSQTVTAIPDMAEGRKIVGHQ
ncbi:hypothetical protein [Paenibacillus alba]|uniref:Uncharacterized protein n=1 Tax=Paenibacillus alba TaxID=1197127 RepID=A0ABU6G4X6_9BACL|nr:hypothetical protein [Paenibacillus alba]MEC0229238.1 hypothetical protein [Paenibacillus alba]